MDIGDTGSPRVVQTDEDASSSIRSKKPTAAKKSRQFKKAPGAPKRFRSAFIFFSQAKHKEIQESLAALGESERTTSVAKRVSEAWRNLSSDERSKWEKMAKTDKERFEKEKAGYKGPWSVPIGHRKSKDPSAPKRPASAFLAFSNSRRAAVKKDHMDASNADISRILAKMWRDAPTEVRKKYSDDEAHQREQYKLSIADWREKEVRKRALSLEDEEGSNHHEDIDEKPMTKRGRLDLPLHGDHGAGASNNEQHGSAPGSQTNDEVLPQRSGYRQKAYSEPSASSRQRETTNDPAGLIQHLTNMQQSQLVQHRGHHDEQLRNLLLRGVNPSGLYYPDVALSPFQGVTRGHQLLPLGLSMAGHLADSSMLPAATRVFGQLNQGSWPPPSRGGENQQLLELLASGRSGGGTLPSLFQQSQYPLHPLNTAQSLQEELLFRQRMNDSISQQQSLQRMQSLLAAATPQPTLAASYQAMRTSSYPQGEFSTPERTVNESGGGISSANTTNAIGGDKDEGGGGSGGRKYQ